MPRKRKDTTSINTLITSSKKMKDNENRVDNTLLHDYFDINNQGGYVCNIILESDNDVCNITLDSDNKKDGYLYHLAMRKGYENDIRIKDKSGNHLIYYSCQLNFKRLTRHLIDKYPCAIGQQNDWERSTNPLHAVCFYNTLHQAIFLMKHFPFLMHLKNTKGEIPLFTAVSRNGVKIIDSMLNTSIDIINIKNDHGQTALIYGCDRRKLPSVLKLLSYDEIDINIVDNDGNTALYYLCYNFASFEITEIDDLYNDYKKVIQLMHKKHPSAFRNVNRQGWNIFHVLASNQSTSFLALKMFAKSIEYMVNDYDNLGRTPFHIASLFENRKVITFIYKLSVADFSLTDRQHGKSGLHFLCENIVCHNYLNFYINNYKINVNAIDNYGNSAVHFLFQAINVSKSIDFGEKCLSMIKTLMDHNIFLSMIKNYAGMLISDIAKDKIEEAKGYKHTSTIQALQDCFSMIEDYETKARWQMYYFFMLHFDGNAKGNMSAK
jgi:ankyrin repeat protein